MAKNYFKIALRNLVRNILYGIDSVSGQDVGIVGAPYLYFYIDGELSYDIFLQNSERIYRVL